MVLYRDARPARLHGQPTTAGLEFHSEASNEKGILPVVIRKNSRFMRLRPAMQAMSSKTRLDGGVLWRDLGIIALVLTAAAGVFVYLELSERLFSWTRQFESVQIDELPAVLLVLATCLVWFAWRRYREAHTQLVKRQEIEQRLEALLFENRQLARQYLQAQESQRKVLARELHDELGQYLNAIKTDAVSIQEKASQGPAPILRAASAIVRHTDHLYDVVRNLIRELRPVALDELGLKAALEHYLDHCRQRMPGIELVAQLDGDIDALAEPLSLAIYRVIQEGVTNASRHASARHITVRVSRHTASPVVTISVSDDGCGMSPDQHHAGLGLIGMRERIEMLNGEWSTTTARGKGFSIAARIPVDNRSAAVSK